MAGIVLLLHGWTMRGAVFDDLRGRLPGLEVLAPDLPGHGALAHLPPSREAGADRVAEVLGDREKVILVGWSMGAGVAWRYIARHGTGRLAALVTVDMSPRMVSRSDWPHGLLAQGEADVRASTRRFAEDWEGGARAVAATMFGCREGAEDFTRDEALAQVLANDPETMRRAWADLLAMDERALVPEIGIPWIACRGAKSRVYPASATRWLVETAPRAEERVFCGSGHSPHLEEPEAFAEMLRELAGRV